MTKKMGVFAVTGMMIAMMATGVLAEDLTKEDVSGLWYITTMEIEGMTMSPADMGLEATLEFGDDDAWEMTMSGEDPEQGTWELAGEEIIMHSDTASDVKMAIDEEGMLIGDIDSTIMTFSREKPEATDWASIIGNPVTDEVKLSDFAGTWKVIAVEMDEMVMSSDTWGMDATLVVKEDGTASLELKDQFNDSEPTKTELKGTLEDQTLKLELIDDSESHFGLFLSPDNLSLNLQDTGLLKNIDYIDSEEEGAEPEPNSIVYFEKAE